MSTKATIFLTEDNEHCYEDSTDETIVMEFSKNNINILINDDEDLIIEIKKDCQLFKIISKIKE